MIAITFSYDYELAWGTWDTMPASYISLNVAGANNAVMQLIECHESFQIPASWALVGAAIDAGDPVSKMKKTKRSNQIQSSFKSFVEQNKDRESEIFRIPSEIFQLLRSKKLFEIGSHTYAHPYALSSSVEELRCDFKLQEQVLKNVLNLRPDIIVFPKNQITRTARQLARQHRYSVARSNPNNWLYLQRKRSKPEGILIRLLRYADAFLPIQELFPQGSTCADDLKTTIGQYFFRPQFKFAWLNVAHRQRLRFGIWLCMKRGENVHIWSHPHNFGARTDIAINNTKKLFRILNTIQTQQRARLLKMSDLAH